MREGDVVHSLSPARAKTATARRDEAAQAEAQWWQRDVSTHPLDRSVARSHARPVLPNPLRYPARRYASLVPWVGPFAKAKATAKAKVKSAILKPFAAVLHTTE